MSFINFIKDFLTEAVQEHHSLKADGYIALEVDGEHFKFGGGRNVYYNPNIKGRGRYVISARGQPYEIIDLGQMFNYAQQAEMKANNIEQPVKQKSSIIKGWQLHSERGLSGRTSDPIYSRQGKVGPEFAQLVKGELQPITNKNHLNQLHKQHRENEAGNTEASLVKMGLPTTGSRNDAGNQQKVHDVLQKIANMPPEEAKKTWRYKVENT